MATLSEIRLQAKERADMVDSDFVEDAEWDKYINNSHKELYDLLVATNEDYFTLGPVAFTIAAGADTSILPTDFYKLRGVDRNLNSGTDGFRTVRPFVFKERNRINHPLRHVQTHHFFHPTVQYRLIAGSLHFLPKDEAPGTYQLWYIPKASELTLDTDVVDGINGWEEYIIVDAAIKALQKEESDVTILLAQKAALKVRIQDMSMDRDAEESETIGDVGHFVNDDFGEF